MPSQVAAILISTRSRPMPAASYRPISRCARATVAAVSKDSRASTSVLTRPGTTFRISQPEAHQHLVDDGVQRLAAVRGHGLGQQRRVVGLLHGLQDQRRVGGGVARRKAASWWKLPVSATTVV
jgi:hypothetical protein